MCPAGRAQIGMACVRCRCLRWQDAGLRYFTFSRAIVQEASQGWLVPPAPFYIPRCDVAAGLQGSSQQDSPSLPLVTGSPASLSPRPLPPHPSSTLAARVTSLNTNLSVYLGPPLACPGSGLGAPG